MILKAEKTHKLKMCDICKGSIYQPSHPTNPQIYVQCQPVLITVLCVKELY